MAFPTIQVADNKSGSQTSNSASWTTLTYPTNIAAGELILLVAGIDGAPSSFTLPAGWVVWWETLALGAATGLVAYKVATGAESGAFTLGMGGSEQGSWMTYRITGWYNGAVPPLAQPDSDSLASNSAIGVTSGTSANPEPIDCDPANWATEDTLWIALAMWDGTPTASVYPLASNQSTLTSGGANGAGIAFCALQDAVASKDPGPFTISASEQWVVYTIAVRPAAEARVPRSPGVDSGFGHF